MTRHQDLARILDQNSVFTTSVSVGNTTLNVFSNSTIIKLANSTVNTGIVVPTAAQYAGSYYLHANGTWQLVAAGATPGGANTQVQFNDSTSLGGTAGFTFNKDTNNAVIANTLTVGSGTINTTNYSGTANNALNLGGTAAASYQLNSTLAANVLTLASNSTTYIPATNGIVSNSTGVWITANAGLLTNSTGLHIGTGNGMVIDTDSIRVLPNTGIVVNSTGVFVNATYIGTLDANNAAFLGGTAAASYQLNSTLAANVATMTANNATWHGTSVFANSTGAYPTSNSTGAVIGNTISRVIITGNSATFSSTLAATDTTITGFVNATTVVNSAAHTVGTTFIANTLGVYHTGTMNAASFTTTGLLANTTGIVPTSNSSGQNLGNTLSRWVITGNSATFTSTLAAGDTSITGFVNATVSVNSALFTTTGFKANTIGIYPTSNTVGQLLGNTISRWELIGNTIDTTGTATIANTLAVTTSVNSALFTTTGFRANTIGVYPTSNSSGQLFGNTISRWAIFANTIDVTTSITANGALGTAAQLLTSNSLGGVYWAAPSGGGNVTKVGTPADDQVGVWTGDGTIEGTAGFTFSAASNNATVANTLTVGNSLLSGTVNAAVFTTTGFRANVTHVVPASNSSGQLFGNTISRWDITANGAALSGILSSDTVNAVTSVNSALVKVGTSFIANTLGAYHTATINAASFTTTGFLANATHVVPTSNSSGQTFGNTIARWVMTANSLTVSGGASPDSNTLGTALGTTTQRWVLIANTIESTGLANVSALNVVAATNTATLFATTSANVGANIQANTTAFGITGNTTTAPSLSISSNSTAAIVYGNSSVTGAPSISLTNSTTNASLSSAGLSMGNSTVNIVANSISIDLSNSTANVIVTPVSIFAGNSIANAFANSIQVSVANATANSIITPDRFFTGNSTVNLFANSTILKLANSTSNTSISVPTAADWAGSKFLHANGTWAAPVAAAAPGGANTNVQYNDSSVMNGTAGFTFDDTTNNVTIANNLNVGANVDLSTTSLFAGNSTVNNTINSVAVAINISPTANLTSNSVLVQLANSSGTSNLTPTSLSIVGKSLTTNATNLIIGGGGLALVTGNSTVSPLHYTSGTLETSPEAGDCSYDGVQFYSTIDTSSGRGAVPVEQYFHLTANGTAGNTITNFFGTTSNPTLVASAYYIIDIHCFFQNTTAGTVVWTFTNSAAPTFQNIMCEMTANTGIVAPFAAMTDLRGYFIMDATAARTTAATTNLTTGVNHYHRFKIWLKNGTGTSLKIQYTKNAGTLTPLLGSFWHCRRISPNNIGTFAA